MNPRSINWWNPVNPVRKVVVDAVIGDGTRYKHTSGVVPCDDVSALPGKDSAWKHHYSHDGYFDVGAKGVVCTH